MTELILENKYNKYKQLIKYTKHGGVMGKRYINKWNVNEGYTEEIKVINLF